ncbi:LPS assembly protein LptD [Acuticoccus sp. MNP-M23]|uniref:LPS-assembly protein LptD n=1 Tax=Acuticoccus sp. MNP-M23 TaxID=3072793 RepID=UPI0028152A0D|nr:LPS assembly protein LptD [Acuticoccus sp. MNP-M23]WMS41282.1 LPS assembly protein LptD [Acuticoccus sp. MNP-M23]
MMRGPLSRLLLASVATIGLASALPVVAHAQLIPQIGEGDTDAKLLLEADSLHYDTRTGSAAAVGAVFIAYQGYQLFASEVTYDRSTNTLVARRGVRLEEPGGNVVIAREVELSDDFRDGFLTGLRADTIYRTRLAANRAERTGGDVTVFEEAGYTACYSCRRRPDAPPTWAIKARRIIADEKERSLRFEDPSFEFFGANIGPLPSFSIPDPSVRRKSGFLMPTAVYNNRLGMGVRSSYFQTWGPSRDVTYGLTGLTRQGALGDITYRQATSTGAFQISAAGIYQLSPDAFDGTSGDRDFRGSLTTVGNFYINPRWQYGWESTITTDRRFLNDYDLTTSDNLTEPTTLYLKGLGKRNSFEARLWAFRILQDDYVSTRVLNPPPPFSGVGQRLQGKQAYVHPAIDYEGVYDGAVLGGELSYGFNTTSLSRQETDAFGAFSNGVLVPRFRGVEGTFARQSAEVAWRKQIIAPLGQVITPFAGARADLFYLNNRDPNVSQLADDEFRLRAMPWVGVNYRYPWLISAGWGTQTIEPVAELIASPNEGSIGQLQNDDAQSLVFDDTTLFGPSKFSGYDRVEGGVRANVGLRYTLQTYAGGFLSATVGQSYHLAGRNSFAVPDILDSTGESGLNTDTSDFVADLTLNTARGFTLSANARFDDETLSVERAELAAAGQAGPLSTRVVYAFLNRQPDLGYIDPREEIHSSASLRVFDRVRLFGMVRYDMQDNDIIRNGAGVAYDDDALSVSLAYSEDRGGLATEPVDRTVFLRLGLRTIGNTSVSPGLDN